MAGHRPPDGAGSLPVEGGDSGSFIAAVAGAEDAHHEGLVDAIGRGHIDATLTSTGPTTFEAVERNPLSADSPGQGRVFDSMTQEAKAAAGLDIEGEG